MISRENFHIVLDGYIAHRKWLDLVGINLSPAFALATDYLLDGAFEEYHEAVSMFEIYVWEGISPLTSDELYDMIKREVAYGRSNE